MLTPIQRAPISPILVRNMAYALSEHWPGGLYAIDDTSSTTPRSLKATDIPAYILSQFGRKFFLGFFGELSVKMAIALGSFSIQIDNTAEHVAPEVPKCVGKVPSG